jgi:hypothetical protein
MPAKSSQLSARIPYNFGPTCRQREFDLSGTPILPRRRKEVSSPQRRPSASEEFGPRLPSHSIRPGLFSKLCGSLARRRQPGSASSSDKLYTLRCATPYYRTAGADTPHPCQSRTSNPSAAAKFPRRARTLTIFPCQRETNADLPSTAGIEDKAFL